MSEQPITFSEASPSFYQAFFENGVLLGDIVKEVDGCFVYYPTNNGSVWESWVMRLIADKLDELNKEWDETIKNDKTI